MDDHDLILLRAFNAGDAHPEPPGLKERIDGDIWSLILAEEAARAGARRHGLTWSERWRTGLLRPAVAAAVAGTLAVGIAFTSDGGTGPTGLGNASAREAGTSVLNGAASALFGGAATRDAAGPVGTIDLGELTDDDALARGPVRAGAELDSVSLDVARNASRNPTVLRDELHRAARAVAPEGSTDRASFDIGMSWVVEPAAPIALRVAMLRAIETLPSLDPPAMSIDLLGRQGLVVGHLDAETGVRDQWVLDLDDARVLERRAYTTSYLDPACPTGTFTAHAIFDPSGLSVDPGSVPYLDWPQVIPACDPGSRVS